MPGSSPHAGTHREVCDKNQNKRSNDRCVY